MFSKEKKNIFLDLNEKGRRDNKGGVSDSWLGVCKRGGGSFRCVLCATGGGDYNLYSKNIHELPFTLTFCTFVDCIVLGTIRMFMRSSLDPNGTIYASLGFPVARIPFQGHYIVDMLKYTGYRI